jgi:VIT1/CCC1 family predicted Fe2+/Mn2+ transporter
VSSRPHSPRQSRTASSASTASAAPPPSAFRARVERVSYPLLVRIHALPRWLVALIPVALLLGGLTAPWPYGSVCLTVLVLLMAWVAYLAWHHGDRLRRVIRMIALGLAVAALVLSLIP